MAYQLNRSNQFKYRVESPGASQRYAEFEKQSGYELGVDKARPIPAEALPAQGVLVEGARLHDYNVFPVAMGVSKRFKDLVESIEPGVHQFFPFEVSRPDGTPYGEPFWLLNVCSKLDTIIPEQSDIKVDWITPTLPNYTRVSGGTHMAMRKDAIAGKAIWREAHYGPTVYFFISDVMADGMAAQGMQGHDYDSSLKHIDEV